MIVVLILIIAPWLLILFSNATEDHISNEMEPYVHIRKQYKKLTKKKVA